MFSTRTYIFAIFSMVSSAIFALAEDVDPINTTPTFSTLPSSMTTEPSAVPAAPLSPCQRLDHFIGIYDLDSRGFVDTLKLCNEEPPDGNTTTQGTSVLLEVYNEINAEQCTFKDEMYKKLVECVNKVLGFKPQLTAEEAKNHFGRNGTRALRFEGGFGEPRNREEMYPPIENGPAKFIGPIVKVIRVVKNRISYQKVDTKLNEAMRCVSGTIKSTPLHWLPVLSHIEPPHLRRLQALKKEAAKIQAQQSLPCHQPFCHPPPHRLKSRHPACVTAQKLSDFDVTESWKHEWSKSTAGTTLQAIDPTAKPEGFGLPRKNWCRVNRLRTGHGRCNYFRHKWGWRDSALCECGEEVQTIEHIIQRCSLHSFPGPPEDLFKLTPDAISWLGTLNVDL